MLQVSSLYVYGSWRMLPELWQRGSGSSIPQYGNNMKQPTEALPMAIALIAV